MSKISYHKYKPTSLDWVTKIPDSWDVIKLKFVCTILSSNVDKHYKDEEKEVRLCNYTDVYYNDSINNKMDLMLATATEAEINKFSLQEHDVIITKDSESFDDIAIPSIILSGCEDIVCGYHLALLRSNPNRLQGQYLYWYLSSELGNYQYKINSNGVTRYGLPKYWIDNSIILLPPVDQQIDICAFLTEENNRLNKIIEVMGGKSAIDHSSTDSMIGRLLKYRSTLLNDVLSGKIDIRKSQKRPEAA